jgi:hypothetical protein
VQLEASSFYDSILRDEEETLSDESQCNIWSTNLVLTGQFFRSFLLLMLFLQSSGNSRSRFLTLRFVRSWREKEKLGNSRFLR